MENKKLEGHIGVSEHKTNEKIFAGVSHELQEIINSTRLITRSLDQGVIIYSPDFRIQMVSPNLQSIAGITEEEAIDKLPSEMMLNIDKGAIMKQMESALKGRKPENLDLKYEKKSSGEVITFRKIVDVIEKTKGNVIGLIGFFTDITTRKNIEQELHDTNEILTLFFKHSPIYAFIKEVNATESKSLMLSDNYVEMLGVEPSSVIGETMEKIFPHEKAREMTEDDISVVLEGKVIEVEEEHNGCKYLTVKFPITQSNRTLVAGFTIDITEMKKTELNLRVTKDLLLSITNGITDLIFTKDPNFKYTSVNNAFELFAGMKESEIIGKQASDVLYLDGNDITLEADIEVIESKKKIKSEITLINNEGDKRTLSVTRGPLYNPRGELSGILGISRDITERIENEKLLALMKEQLEIKAKMESLNTFVGGMGHDMNNLLSPLIGYLDLALLSGPLTEKAISHIKKSQKAANHIADLMHGFQTLSKNAILLKTNLDMYKIVKGINFLLEKTIQETKNDYVRIETNFNEGDFFVYGNEDEIRSVLINLLKNSLFAFAERGPQEGDFIKIMASESEDKKINNITLPKGDYIYILVEDNGCGMPASVRRRAFEPLYSTRKNKAERGQGLGLYMVYTSVCKKLDGDITIESSEGIGTKIHMYLPKAIKEEITNSEENNLVENNLGEKDRRGNETILVIEDENTIRELVKEILELSGYKVLLAVDGQEGLDTYIEKEDEVDLVLLDLTMPNMSGQTVLKHMLEINDKVKVIISSGQNKEETTDTLFKAKGFVHKPYSLKELIDTIRSVLDNNKE